MTIEPQAQAVATGWRAADLGARLAAAALAALMGAFLLYSAGFAQTSVLHNAAHDGRHSFTFPCH